MRCASCGQLNDDEAHFCRKCGNLLPPRVPAAGAQSVTVSTPMEPEVTRFAVDKVPIVALFFAIIPGFGQFYNGDFKKGLLVLFLAVVASGLAIPTGFISILAVWLWGLTNAYNVAARKTPLWT